MDSKKLKEARISLGLSLAEMAALLGYQSENVRNLNTMQRDLENGSRSIREPQRRLVEAYLDGYRPKDWPTA